MMPNQRRARAGGYRVVTFADDPGRFYWKSAEAVAFRGETSEAKAWDAACADIEHGFDDKAGER